MRKIILFLLIICMNYTKAVTLDEINAPMDFMGRLGNSDKVEARKQTLNDVSDSKIIKKATNDTIEDTSIGEKEIKEIANDEAGVSYADLSLKKLANDVAIDLEMDEAKINSDLSILWNATTERSETIKYTIYKLANPDEDKPNDTMIKKILKPIANISSLAGASVSSNPFVAAGSLIGGGLFSALMKDDKEVNYTFSKVSDADMVLLIRKIDTLQKKLIDLYMDYKTKQEIYNLENEKLEKNEANFYSAKNKSKEELTIADVYYRNSKIKTQKARNEYMTSRAILENLVGKDALEKIEE